MAGSYSVVESKCGTPFAGHAEALRVVEVHGLAGTGIGWVGVHLLAAARLSGATLWTADRQLKAAALALGCGIEDQVSRVRRN